jgi:hypothetical protein
MANPKYAAPDTPPPVAELIATLSDGTKVKRRIPRIPQCPEKSPLLSPLEKTQNDT